ncbi:AEC family transporter [Arhodomonas sp. KWT]|uniref:AEC family transporter n=1 Tax=Arhodomonas sp. KWT TaxID=2679915 RepID=UPI0013D201B1|nr:AEC family transporter [Arhodomonas sp. KWT]
MLLRILEIIVPVFGLVLVGYVYGRLRPADMSSANRLNVNVFVPALIFFVLSERMSADLSLGGAALGAAAVILGSGPIAWLIARRTGWDVRTVVPPAMFNNAGNFGLPLAVFGFGEDALPVAVVMFVVENSLHFTVGLWLLTRRIGMRELAGNPMVVATAAGLICMSLGWHLPDLVLPGVEMLGNVAIPLMLVALGIRLTEVDLSYWRIGIGGALMAPVTGLIIAVPWVLIFQPPQPVAGLLLVFGALPPAVLNYMLSEHYDQEPQAVASIVALGNLMSLGIIPAVLYFALP